VDGTLPEGRERPSASPGHEAPAIADYAIIGDCRTAALVSRDGSIDWLCLPHFSGPSMFAALLDPERGGRFAIGPAQACRSSRRYVGPSPVLETRFETAAGRARLLDLMPVVDDPGALHPLREVLRLLVCEEGEVAVDVGFAPRPDYGRSESRLVRRGKLGFACTHRDELLLLASDVPLELAPDGSAVLGRVVLTAGQSASFRLSYVKGDLAVVAPTGRGALEDRLRRTLLWWEEWASQCRYRGPHESAVLRSAVTLKLMTYALSGAVVAAPTASLPEWIGADRNWDYRYCWLRDAALTMRAFTGLGYREEAGSFLQWLLHATRLTWPKLQVMYDVYGRTNLTESELGHLTGHRGSRPVRIGNGAHRQEQLDVYGGVVSAAFDYAMSGARLQKDEAKLLEGFAETALKCWDQPDHGIWEIRGEKRHYTFSKVMCWAAVDSIVKLHEAGQVRVDVERFRRGRDAIAQAVETQGYSKATGSYAGVFDGDEADAALLLMACLGYKDATDPRMVRTFERLEERLGRGGLLMRYEPGYDRLSSREGAFGICSFWAVDNLARRGDVERAQEAFEGVLAYANDVGLFAEEVDPDTGAALGNFPQAFTHVGLINAALALEEARRKRG
jgi:GH15 family glucan-1,4-alpha-glucosidase